MCLLLWLLLRFRFEIHPWWIFCVWTIASRIVCIEILRPSQACLIVHIYWLLLSIRDSSILFVASLPSTFNKVVDCFLPSFTYLTYAHPPPRSGLVLGYGKLMCKRCLWTGKGKKNEWTKKRSSSLRRFFIYAPHWFWHCQGLPFIPLSTCRIPGSLQLFALSHLFSFCRICVVSFLF